MKSSEYDILWPDEGTASLDSGKPNYNAFISGLLSNPSTTKEDRERIVQLLMKERDDKFVTKEQMLLLLNELDKKYVTKKQLQVFLKNTKIQEIEDEKKKQDYPEPKQTYEFLSFFSRNDGGLKNLTHPFNYGYIEYDAFIAKCREEFEEGKRLYPKVPTRLLGRIKAFAFDEEPNWYIQKWLQTGKKTIKHGWSEPSFIEWYKTNRIHPFKDAFYNREMIVPFKESIQVRSDTGNLISLLKSLVKNVFGETPSCNVIISKEVENAQFYTDVDSLGAALNQMFSTIKEYSEMNFCGEVEIDYSIEGVFKVLTVTHIDSKPTKRADDKDYLGGNTDAIKKQLMGLCNYEICAEFPDGAYRKLILYDFEDYKKYQKDKNAKIIVNERGEKKEITILVPLDPKIEIKGYTHKMLFY